MGHIHIYMIYKRPIYSITLLKKAAFSSCFDGFCAKAIPKEQEDAIEVRGDSSVALKRKSIFSLLEIRRPSPNFLISINSAFINL